jgi:iron complex transport system permease protein
MTRHYQAGVSLLIVWSLFAVWHISAGAVNVPWGQVIETLSGEVTENEFIIWGYRFPRMVVASLVGASLALSGLLVQGVVRNPLASPDVLGVTSGASLAVVLSSALLTDIPIVWLPLIALLGGAITTAVLLWLAWHVLHQPAALALIGIALAAVCSAGIDFLLISHPMEINTSMIWLTGSIWGRNWSHLPMLSAWLLLLLPAAIILAYRLDLLGLGDETAQGLGQPVFKVRIMALVVSIALACVAVSICGNIGFVGLVAPHVARFLTGGRHLSLIPVTMFVGAIILLSADLFARILMPPIELPAGILTAFIGAPYFIFLLTRYKRW